MKLKVLDRLAVSSVLPAQGNFITLSVAAEIRNKIKIDEDERTRLNFVGNPDGSIGWNPVLDQPVAFSFSDIEKVMIKKAFRELDASNKLNTDQLGAFRLFVLEPPALENTNG